MSHFKICIDVIFFFERIVPFSSSSCERKLLTKTCHFEVSTGSLQNSFQLVVRAKLKFPFRGVNLISSPFVVITV